MSRKRGTYQISTFSVHACKVTVAFCVISTFSVHGCNETVAGKQLVSLRCASTRCRTIDNRHGCSVLSRLCKREHSELRENRLNVNPGNTGARRSVFPVPGEVLQGFFVTQSIALRASDALQHTTRKAHFLCQKKIIK